MKKVNESIMEEGYRRSSKVMEGHGRSWKVMEGHGRNDRKKMMKMKA
jgi:hypothetical protein